MTRACPWCMSEDVVVLHNEDSGVYMAMCEGCQSTGPVGDSQEMSLDNWNSRGMDGWNIFDRIGYAFSRIGLWWHERSIRAQAASANAAADAVALEVRKRYH